MWIKLVLCLTIAQQFESARILFIAPTPSLSHNLFFQPIIRELCLRGHHVVSITPDLINQPTENLTQIDIRNETYPKFNAGDYLLKLQQEKPRYIDALRTHATIELEMIEAIVKNPQVKEVYENSKFDLIILENIFYLLFNTWKDHFKCPLIGVISLDLWLPGADQLGNPVFPSFHVDYQRPAGKNLSFWRRLDNFWYSLELRWMWYREIIPNEEALIKKLYGKDVNLHEMQSNVDLVLANTNPIFHLPKPAVPALISIGGLHTHQRKTLPQVSDTRY